MTIRFYKAFLAFIIIGVWSSAIFELGFTYFIQRLGFSLFRLFGALLICNSLFYLVVIRKGKLLGRMFLQKHKVLVFTYVIYWLISWLGILYSSDADRGFLICLQYFWYTILAALTILLLLDFSMRKRKTIFLFIGLLSAFVMFYFSAIAFLGGVPYSILAERQGRFSLSIFNDYNVFTYSLLLSVLLIFTYVGNHYSHISFIELLLYCILILSIAILGVISGSRRTIVLYCPIAFITPFVLLGLRSIRRFVGKVFIFAVLITIVLISALNRSHSEVTTETFFGHLDRLALIDLKKRISRGLGFLTGYYTETDRIERWRKAWNIAGEYSVTELFWGRGTRSYFSESEFTRSDGSRDSPHNFLLSALLEGGAIKLVFLLLFVTVWLRHIIILTKDSNIWIGNFLIVSNSLWILTVLISGEEFFYSKQFLLIFAAYAALWDNARDKNVLVTYAGAAIRL